MLKGGNTFDYRRYYLKWDTLAEKSKIKTRAITNKQKDLFEKYVTEDYIKTFINECEKLMANFDVDIVSRGSSGQTLKKLQIKGKAPGKVLSEGEQRAISIANFLMASQSFRFALFLTQTILAGIGFSFPSITDTERRYFDLPLRFLFFA